MKIDGVWLPIVTPFKNGEVDYSSYQRLIEFYLSEGISGIIPLGTTGESPTMTAEESIELIEKTIDYVQERIPIIVGLGGNCTKEVIERLNRIEKMNINGILSVCPYYNRPDQKGIYEHFEAIANSTNLSIVIYNIPYRTGRNVENETLLRLAELKNIIAVKDSCGNIVQSIELINNKPEGFSVLTGEDIHFYNVLINGGDGGILASSHLYTRKFMEIYSLIKENNYQAALNIWRKLSALIPYLFKESNPAPLKYCLQKRGLIKSQELRLPLTNITSELSEELDFVLQGLDFNVK